jgi:hypothetical protein
MSDYREGIQTIQYEDVIINAVARKGIRYENPASIEIKYEIEFETPAGQTFRTEPKTIEEIVAELKVKGLVYKLRAAEEALAAVLNALYRDNKMIIRREIETPGFYLVGGKIVGFKIEQHKQPTKEEIIKCIEVLNELISKYERKEVIATALIWGVVSPFSFVLKQIEEQGEERRIPWPYLHGWTNTGKTTTGRIILAIWRKHTDKKKHDIGFSSADNVPRFARQISYDTYPVLINEVQLNDSKQLQLVETLKHAIQSQTARGRLLNKSTAESISALSPCILTSNYPPPNDPAFQRRITPIHYTPQDEPTDQEKELFKRFLNDNMNTLGILGDFVVNYVLNNQDIIFRNTDWRPIGRTILTELFRSVEKEIPSWIDSYVEQTQVQDIADEQEQLLRGFILQKINDTYIRNYRSLTSWEDVNVDQTISANKKLENRLIFCCDNDLIPFLRRKDGSGDILITHNIIKDMHDNRINNINSLTEIAGMLQREVKPVKLGSKTTRVISIPIGKLMDFVLPEL